MHVGDLLHLERTLIARDRCQTTADIERRGLSFEELRSFFDSFGILEDLLDLLSRISKLGEEQVRLCKVELAFHAPEHERHERKAHHLTNE